MNEAAAMIGEVTHRLFGDYATDAGADGRELPGDLWARMEEIGLLLALVPAEAGGSGLAFSDVAPLFQEIGRFAIGAPLAETMIAAAILAQASIAIPAGILSIAMTPDNAPVDLRREGDGWQCSGTLARVPWADVAVGIVIVSEYCSTPHVALIDPRRCERSSGVNVAGQARDTLSIDHILADANVSPLPDAPRIAELGAAIRTAQIAGALDDLVTLTATYAQDRVQFGRPIGKFQAVQHLLAALAGHAAVALAAADLAAEAIDGSGDRLDIAIAKAAASAAAGEGAAIAHQVHGAIGVTREHRLHRSTLRLLSWRDEYGGEGWWQAEIGRAACATGGGPALWARLAR